MLGESHALLVEFPAHKATIEALGQSDQAFTSQMQKYDALDKEIRELELSNSPIEDNEMHQMKHQRSILKDQLYQCLLHAS
ncbi:YdcH family protein [Paraglaciecola chathamensis]|uniref:DUF465 domain-containing protein n=1 Tax=Paraglaciecola chathamensis S18K6 TaxID=1127672 RepID=A0AAV3UW31_9ALTE|nr:MULTISPECIES: YdcH family protein [Paraglaciecola]AEE23304.1 hypothetical protein Glaag_2360 [Glaciecola sp. 4H-3-7+YE-5]MBN27114.1 DUF465 domain-containing protein [Alteromonadaceae bacterium]GAC09284.1 conserved hypothetical protein [Paraglaciecola chathamensis S18K6]|tara:strand:- start:170 stop:412 length:243 start_codon:yes stop_codon:yes gene_type:complete